MLDVSAVTGHHAMPAALLFTSKDGWMTCDFRTLQQYFSHIRTTGGSYLKVVGNGTPFMVERSPPPVGLEPGIARSVGQWLTN